MREEILEKIKELETEVPIGEHILLLSNENDEIRRWLISENLLIPYNDLNGHIFRLDKYLITYQYCEFVSEFIVVKYKPICHSNIQNQKLPLKAM